MKVILDMFYHESLMIHAASVLSLLFKRRDSNTAGVKDQCRLALEVIEVLCIMLYRYHRSWRNALEVI